MVLKRDELWVKLKTDGNETRSRSFNFLVLKQKRIQFWYAAVHVYY